MRSRMIDLALLIGLVVVSGGILWTLFTLGREPRVASTPPRPAPAAEAPATSGAASGASTADAAGGSAGARGVVAVDPDAPNPTAEAAAANEAASVDDEATASGGAAADAEADGEAADAGLAAPVAPPRVLPSGTLELERIGYSFVTGGPGSCGVVLEAWTHVAVSRDLLEAYGCGAEVTVTLDDPVDGRTEVLAVIGDTMNPSFSRTVNVYVGEDEPAFEYGLTAGTFRTR